MKKDIAWDIVDNMEEIEKVREKNRADLRLYGRLPGLNLIGIDNRYFLAWFWSSQNSSSGPCLEIQGENRFVEFLQSHFDDQWQNASELRFKNTGNELLDIRRKEPGLELQSILGGKDLVYFRCYFYREGEYRCFQLSYSPTIQRVTINHTRSGEIYNGSFRSVKTASSMILKSSDRHRIAYIVAELGNFRFEEHEVVLGLLTNIRTEGTPVTGRIVLERVPSILDEKNVTPNQIPLGIKNYLNAEELTTDRFTKGWTMEKLEDKFGLGNEKNMILYDHQGSYDYYTYSTKLEKIIRRSYSISLEGKVEVHENGKLLYHGEIFHIHKGSISIKIKGKRGDSVFFIIYRIPKKRDAPILGITTRLIKGGIHCGRIFIVGAGE
ncbi:MAG: hypothetical protein AAFY41_16585, partial [Bacteroidota bacterium]